MLQKLASFEKPENYRDNST